MPVTVAHETGSKSRARKTGKAAAGEENRAASRRQVEMARRILAFIRRERLAEGAHLREQQLAVAFGTSRTPIRKALKLLEDKGVVRIEANLGAFVARPASDLHGVDLVLPPSNDDQLYMRIADDRLSGRLPERVTQVEMQRRYDVDRPLVERVLARMADEGLVIRSAGHGWSFQPTFDSHRARRASYQFRLVIEPAALLLPDYAPKPDVLAFLRSEHEMLLEQERHGGGASGQELFHIDALFHETVVDFSGNPMFTQAVQAQNSMRRMLEHRGYIGRRRIEDWCREHLAVIAAIEKRDMKTASQLLKEHLQHAEDSAASLP